MIEKEIMSKNLILSTEFDRYVLEHPEFAEKIPPNALVVLMPVDDPELCVVNKELAQQQREKDQGIVYVRIGKVFQLLSRLTDVSLENVA